MLGSGLKHNTTMAARRGSESNGESVFPPTARRKHVLVTASATSDDTCARPHTAAMHIRAAARVSRRVTERTQGKAEAKTRVTVFSGREGQTEQRSRVTEAARDDEAGVEVSVRPLVTMNARTEGSVVAARTRTDRGSGEEDCATPLRNSHFPERESRPTRRAKCEESWYGRKAARMGSTLCTCTL
jgi:hypothetical protein